MSSSSRRAPMRGDRRESRAGRVKQELNGPAGSRQRPLGVGGGGVGGSQQGLEAVKSRPLQPRTAPRLSQSQRGKDLNLE
ncbi:hypothetical protein EYF80_045185 [Liparis tanakae]|uniref:Uncharacterized protein n=1 Tax=Liparis tanakae TaxID=230148 RepID=A0A4Z2FUT5_9TELE|nr:hypothetical protein EYF80_045185 [Liparis tanakae]